MFAVLAGASLDWNVAAAAAATFVVTGVATAFGFRKGYKKVEADRLPATVPIVGASLMDNLSIVMLTEALRDNTELQRQIHTCLTEIKVMIQLSLNKRS